MEQFSVKLSGMKQRIQEEENYKKRLGTIEDQLNSVRNTLSFEVGSKLNISKAIKQLANNVGEFESDMKTMKSVLQNVYNEYEKQERRICGYFNDHPITTEDIWNAITTTGTGLVISAINPALGFGWLVNEILKDEEWETESDWGKFEKKIWEKERGKEVKYTRDEEGNWVKKEDDDSDGKKEKTDGEKKQELLENITIWSGSIGKEGELLHFGTDGDVETEYGKYSYGMDVMKAYAKAGANVTLGNAALEVGVGLTAFSAEAAGQLGSDMLGVHGQAGVNVGKVEAKAGGTIGWVNEEGELDLHAKVEASAEAILAEAEASVGVDLLGTKADIKGSVNFGIGAHAEIGFDDGKFSFDVGASLGVGASVSFEVDVSGTVDAVVDFAKDVGNVASEAYSAVSDFANDVGDKVSDFASDVGDSLSKGWKTVTGWFS